MLIVYHKLYTEHQMLHETCFRCILVYCWKCYGTCKNYRNISRNLHKMNSCFTMCCFLHSEINLNQQTTDMISLPFYVW